MEDKCLCYLLAPFPEKKQQQKKPPPFDLQQFQKAPKPELTNQKKLLSCLLKIWSSHKVNTNNSQKKDLLKTTGIF